MRFLMLGYKPYLPMILAALRETSFLVNNEFDVVLAQPPLKQKAPMILNEVKHLLNATELAAFSETLGHPETVSDMLFRKIDLTFLATFPNVRFLPYHGLNKLENLETYDYMIVASYARKIPRTIYDRPRYGTLNTHPSLLPDLRGGYPTYIQAFDPTAVRGTTIHLMSEEWDEGEIVAQLRDNSSVPLTNEALLSQSAEQTARLLNRLCQQGFRYQTVPQDSDQATYCHQILQRQFNPAAMPSASSFAGYVRANYDRYLFPHTFTLYKNQLFIILDVQPSDLNGFALRQDNKAIFEVEDRFYIRFDQTVFQVTDAIYQGNHLQQPVNSRLA